MLADSFSLLLATTFEFGAGRRSMSMPLVWAASFVPFIKKEGHFNPEI